MEAAKQANVASSGVIVAQGETFVKVRGGQRCTSKVTVEDKPIDAST